MYTQGEVPPYVQGQIQHQDSGLSLTGGGTNIALINFNVDPDTSKVHGDVTVNGQVTAPVLNKVLKDHRVKPGRLAGIANILVDPVTCVRGRCEDPSGQ